MIKQLIMIFKAEIARSKTLTKKFIMFEQSQFVTFCDIDLFSMVPVCYAKYVAGDSNFVKT